jgi:tRNA(fMet)-specific endonuclease VapC
MRYLLDTNACIKYINGDSESVKLKLQSYKPEDILLCSIVKSELMYGVLKSNNKTKNREKLDLFFAPFDSLSFDDTCAKIYSEIRADLEKKGSIIGAYDMQIAAIAIHYNLTLVTHNTKEFSRIQNLRIEDWE